jgi:uncharacterized protein YfeS
MRLRGQRAERTRNDVETLDDDWELSEETAHPNAVKLLKQPFFWDIGDESSPFGNETGADVLQFYRAALDDDPHLDSGDFLSDLFEECDLDRRFAEGVPDEDLANRLEREHFHILTYDDAVVATAFAEIVLLGADTGELADAAIRSLTRQSMPEVLEFRGWSDPALRVAHCEEMIGALQAAA